MISINDAEGRRVDTIGGGKLEYMVTEQARQLLSQPDGGNTIQHFPLAASADQCCGGSVTALFEVFCYSLNVAIFGAGNVGREVAGLIERLDAKVSLLDSRQGIPDTDASTYEYCADAVDRVGQLEPNTHVLVMTHSHQLDYDIVLACLRQQLTSIGLIGSDTKWQRFRARLIRDGQPEHALSRVRCPLGVPHVRRKEPLAVALSIVTELLQLEPVPEAKSLSWRQIKSSLVAQP